MISVDRQKFFDATKQKVTKSQPHATLFSAPQSLYLNIGMVGQAKQDNGIRRFHCSDGRIADLDGHGRERGIPVSSPHFLLASPPTSETEREKCAWEMTDLIAGETMRWWMAGVKKTLALLLSVLLFQMNRLLIKHHFILNS